MAPVTCCPATLAEAREIVTSAARDRRTVLPIGCGSKRAWLALPEPAGVELGTRGLAGIVAYEPGDGTITALGGTLWSDLVAATSARGHHLSPEIPFPDDATLGGVLASGQSGLDRLRHGPVRHQVLGMQVLLADGTLARSGGRLVKNVTGFDVHRLHTGAHGSLGVVVEASLRLHPAPEARAIGTLACAHRTEALGAARAALDPAIGALAVVVEQPGPGDVPVQVAVLLAARADVLPHQVRELRARLGEIGLVDGAAARDGWRRYRDLELARGAWPLLHIGCLPAHLERIWTALDREVRGARTAPAFLSHPGLATLDAWIELDGADHAARLATALRAEGAAVRLRGAPLAEGREIPGADVMRRLRQILDPAGLWAPRLEGLAP